MRRWARTSAYESSRLNWVAGYFTIAAGFSGLVWVMGGLGALLGWGGMRAAFTPVGWALTGVVIGSWALTGHLLRERRRAGGWLALGALLPPVLQVASGGGVSIIGAIVPALGALAVLSAWRELD